MKIAMLLKTVYHLSILRHVILINANPGEWDFE